MSGFYADSGRIRVIETVNNVDETVFDTDEDMPHIVGTAQINDITVDFTALSQTQNYAFYDTCISNTCLGYVWYWQTNYVPPYWYYTTQFVYEPGGYNFLYGQYSYGSFYSTTTRVTDPGYYTYDRVWETSYTECCAEVVYQWSIDARENASTVDIADVPVDEDGNAVAIDFIVVQATGTRTAAGKDPRFDQALPSTVPTKTFSFQGSVLLESSGKANGDSFFRRIMSVFVSGGKLKLKSQESVATLVRGAYNSAFPHAAESKSTYNFNFKVFFGRFKS